MFDGRRVATHAAGAGRMHEPVNFHMARASARSGRDLGLQSRPPSNRFRALLCDFREFCVQRLCASVTLWRVRFGDL